MKELTTTCYKYSLNLLKIKAVLYFTIYSFYFYVYIKINKNESSSNAL